MILFVSPHLDDAVFSAGALIADLARDYDVVIATVFTRSVTDPTGFALACQTDKRIPASVDYMALRRAEDARAAAELGARALWLDLPEAPHRSYDCAAALFGPRHECDDLAPVVAAIAPLVRQADMVFGPLGHGRHVDHLLVRDALDALSRSVLWLDLPYALRTPRAPDAAPPLRPRPAKPAALAAKLAACAAYQSQLDFQFGGDRGMCAAMSGAAECFFFPPDCGKPGLASSLFSKSNEAAQ